MGCVLDAGHRHRFSRHFAHLRRGRRAFHPASPPPQPTHPRRSLCRRRRLAPRRHVRADRAAPHHRAAIDRLGHGRMANPRRLRDRRGHRHPGERYPARARAHFRHHHGHFVVGVGRSQSPAAQAHDPRSARHLPSQPRRGQPRRSRRRIDRGESDDLPRLRLLPRYRQNGEAGIFHREHGRRGQSARRSRAVHEFAHHYFAREGRRRPRTEKQTQRLGDRCHSRAPWELDGALLLRTRPAAGRGRTARRQDHEPARRGCSGRAGGKFPLSRTESADQGKRHHLSGRCRGERLAQPEAPYSATRRGSGR